jgi:hypothetical protein
MIENTIAAAKASGARILLPGMIYNYRQDAFPVLREDSPQTATTHKGKIRIALEKKLEDAEPREGIVVTTEHLSDVISGKSRFWAETDFDLFMERKERRDRPLSIPTNGAHPRASMWIAPSGPCPLLCNNS